MTDRVEEQKSRRAEEQKNRRTEEQKNRRTEEQESRKAGQLPGKNRKSFDIFIRKCSVINNLS